MRVERLNLQRGFGDWLVEAGDIYQQLGRGQLLSLRKVDELGLDVALRGGRVGYSSSAQVATAFAGVANVVNLDSVSQRFVEDKLDLIAGGQYGLRGELGEVGVMYLAVRPDEQQYHGLPLPDATSAGGLYFDAPALTDWASLYVEVDAQQRRALEHELNESAMVTDHEIKELTHLADQRHAREVRELKQGAIVACVGLSKIYKIQ